MLCKHGLLGEYRFAGKEGILSFVRQAGCIQYDPVDVCGRNADLVLQSRIKGYRKPMLYELLYTDRKLVDYFDKNLAVIPAENWKYFGRERLNHRDRESAGMATMCCRCCLASGLSAESKWLMTGKRKGWM